MCDQQSLRSACAYAQSNQSLCSSLEYSMNIKLLTEQHLEFLSFKGCCTCSPESRLVKMPHSRKSHVAAILLYCQLSVPYLTVLNDDTFCFRDDKLLAAFDASADHCLMIQFKHTCFVTTILFSSLCSY